MPEESDFKKQLHFSAIPDDTHNPERLAIKTSVFEQLSQEAKEVIGLIINGPKSFIQAIQSPKTKKINIYRIEKQLRKQWSSRLRVKRVIAELHEYVKTF